MKYFLIIFLFFSFELYSQQTDANTLAIQNYFQMENSLQQADKEKYSTKTDQNSIIDLIQVGNDNKIYINSLQIGDQQSVNQAGSQNNYEYYNYYSRENSDLNVNQEGTLNSLQVFGENSLMKGATIKQKSNYKDVVIKNYTN